jgi:hypothetical protein
MASAQGVFQSESKNVKAPAILRPKEVSKGKSIFVLDALISEKFLRKA